MSFAGNADGNQLSTDAAMPEFPLGEKSRSVLGFSTWSFA
jgi:hypothetical protein